MPSPMKPVIEFDSNLSAGLTGGLHLSQCRRADLKAIRTILAAGMQITGALSPEPEGDA